MAYNFFIPNLRKLLTAVFDPTSGHDHDGLNSKAVTTGTPAAGALSADSDGRAIMGNGYFDAGTVATKFADDAITNAVADAKIADEAFAADADSRAKFADGIWKLDKLDAEARTHILLIPVEDLDAGADIASRLVFEAPAGFDITMVSAKILSQGAPTGIDDSNTCVVKLENGSSNEIVEKTYDTSNAFPAAGTVGDLGTLSETYKVLVAGEKLVLSVTNGVTANPPRFVIQVVYTMAAAA